MNSLFAMFDPANNLVAELKSEFQCFGKKRLLCAKRNPQSDSAKHVIYLTNGYISKSFLSVSPDHISLVPLNSKFFNPNLSIGVACSIVQQFLLIMLTLAIIQTQPLAHCPFSISLRVAIFLIVCNPILVSFFPS